MFRKFSTVFCSLALATGLTFAGGSAEMVPCERPLKHLNCQDLKDLQAKKNCEVEVPVCDPVETIVEKTVEVPVPVPFAVEVIKEVPVEKQIFVPVPVCAACDFVKQWNIQVVGGQNNFVGLQGRFKDFGIRVGQYDIDDIPSFASEQVTEAATTSSSRNDDHKTTICHKNKVTITVDNSALPAHFAHGDTVGACQENGDPEDPPTCSCDDGVCREECPQNCPPPPECGDGICAENEQCPEDCNPPEEPKQPKRLAQVEVGHAYTIEGLYFIPLPNRCSNLSLYIGAGVTRKTEATLLQDIETGRIFQVDPNNEYKPSGTVGAEYRLPFSMVVGGGYSTASGFLLHAGYSYRFK